MRKRIEKKMIGKIAIFLVVGMFMAIMLVPLASAVNVDQTPSATGSYKIDIDSDSDSSTQNFIVSHDGGTELFRIQENGRVGIGTTSPNAGLDVQVDITLSDFGAKGVNFEQTLTAYDNEDTLTALYIDPTFADGEFEDVQHYGLIVEDGNVGIGIATPDNKFHICAGSAGNVDSATDSVLTIENSAESYIQLLSPNMYSQGINFGDNDNPSAGRLEYCNPGDIMAFWVNNEISFVINDQHRVGIGNYQYGKMPQEKLTLISGSNFTTEMTAPGKPSGTPQTSGGSMADGTYYYVITAIDGIGETIKGTESDPITISGSGGSGSVDLTWTAVTGAKSYKVYRTTTSGTYTSTAYIANPTINSYTDVAASPSAGAPPTSTTAYVNKITASGNSWFLGGNVGIGTTAPAAILHIGSDSDTGTAGKIHIGDQDSSYSSEPEIYSQPGTGADLYLKASSTDADVYIRASDSSSAENPGVYIQDDDASLGVAYFGTGGIYAGNVGIGTASPNTKLEVMDIIGIESSLHSTELSGRLRYTHSGSWATGKLHLGINGGAGVGIFDVLTISYQGWVGIGNSNPQLGGDYLLKIGQSDGVSGRIQFLSSDGDEMWMGITTNDEFAICNCGNVGIGTNDPSAALEIFRTSVDPSIYFNSGAGGDDFSIGVDLTDNYFKIGTTSISTNTRLTIDNSGNVGIGTISPTATLDINGGTGYNQLRMRTSYTPSGTSDGNGNTGDIAWDNTCIYIKTSVGWKRCTLSTF